MRCTTVGCWLATLTLFSPTPACAGMTKNKAGMTKNKAGMTKAPYTTKKGGAGAQPDKITAFEFACYIDY